MANVSQGPGRLKPVILSIFGHLTSEGWSPGCFLGHPFCTSKQGFGVPGSELLGNASEGCPPTEKWPMRMTGFIVTGLRCCPAKKAKRKLGNRNLDRKVISILVLTGLTGLKDVQN